MRAYVITLDPAGERYARTAAALTKGGVAHAAHPGVNGRDVAASARRGLTPSIYGCYKSHASLWERCVQLDEPILVLEDDAAIAGGGGEDVAAAIQSVERATADYGCVFLGCTGSGGALDALYKLACSAPPPRTVELRDPAAGGGAAHRARVGGGQMGTFAYILRPRGAAALIAGIGTTPTGHVDKEMWCFLAPRGPGEAACTLVNPIFTASANVAGSTQSFSGAASVLASVGGGVADRIMVADGVSLAYMANLPQCTLVASADRYACGTPLGMAALALAAAATVWAASVTPRLIARAAAAARAEPGAAAAAAVGGGLAMQAAYYAYRDTFPERGDNEIVDAAHDAEWLPVLPYWIHHATCIGGIAAVAGMWARASGDARAGPLAVRVVTRLGLFFAVRAVMLSATSLPPLPGAAARPRRAPGALAKMATLGGERDHVPSGHSGVVFVPLVSAMLEAPGLIPESVAAVMVAVQLLVPAMARAHYSVDSFVSLAVAVALVRFP